MKTRVLTSGFLAGLFISLGALYPAISLVAPLSIPTLIRPIQNELGHGIALMISAAVSFGVLVSFGGVAARLGGARALSTGAKMGALAGLIVGITTFITVISPLLALFAYGEIAEFIPNEKIAFPPQEALDSYVTNMVTSPTNWIFICLGANALLGAIGGAWRGRQNGRQPAGEALTLSGHMAAGRHPSNWFGEDKYAIFVAIVSGLGLGLLNAFMRINFFASLNTLTEDLSAITAQLIEAPAVDMGWTVHTILASLLLGGVVVYFIPNPPDRWRTRIRATIVAAHISLIPLLVLSMRYLFLWLGLLPYIGYQQLSQLPEAEANGLRAIVSDQFVQSHFFGTAVFGLPWLIIILSLIGMFTYGSIQGLFYAWFVPMMRPRAVDIAQRVLRKMKREPQNILPILYQQFDQRPDAYDILAQISTCTYRKHPDVSQLTAFFHTLGTSEKTAEHGKAVAGIKEIVSNHPDWRWAHDFGAVFESLDQVMSAWTLEQILSIPPVAEQTTASLPTNIVRNVQIINDIINELHKVERVNDNQSKTIFLENSLQAISKAIHINTGVEEEYVTPPPERLAILTSLRHWQSTVLEVLQRMKGRADIISNLSVQSCPISTQVPVVYQIKNQGLNVAQKVRMRVRETDDYYLVKNGHSDVYIDILTPGEEREVQIPIVPRNSSRRVRLEWEIEYDDAVDDNCHLEFGDVLEFSDPAKPFKRVFPIPYVTGTPLKSDDVFVGREEIFQFIRENLIGVKQNNVIILHGQRRTGKTSVLYRLGRIMTESHIAVLIDMQGKPARSAADFLFSIADDIVFALEDEGIEIDPPERADFEDAPEFFFRSRFLRQLKPLLGDRNILLLFDEFEELQQRVEAGRLSADIFAYLRNLMQHEDHVDFVFSGTHKLEALGAEYWSILFNIAIYRPITFLSRSEIEWLTTQPVADYNVEYDPLALKRISQVTAGHPYFTQLLLHEMMVYHNETQRNYLTVLDVDQVLERIVERGEAHFKYIWAESSEQERYLLRSLTELLNTADVTTLNELQQFLSARGHQWDESWQQGMHSLQSRDIIAGDNGRRYWFKVEIIQFWIARTREAIV